MSFNSNDRIVTQIYCSVLMTVSPSYEFTDMILSDVFPYDISYNSIGSTRFSTDVIVVDSGNDQRIQRWSQPLMEYDISYGVRTMEQLQALVSFFRAMRGRLYAFDYYDHLDASSSTAVIYEARTVPTPTAFDQVIGVGDGSTYVFQLQKTYASPQSGATQVRTITRTVSGSELVGINGNATTHFTVDSTTGLVTLTPPVTCSPSDAVSKTAQSSSYCTITGEAGDFSGLSAYANNGHYVIVSGFANGVNNAPISAPSPKAKARSRSSTATSTRTATWTSSCSTSTGSV
jgi:uncharacterized protein (TIGR02217 family)